MNRVTDFLLSFILLLLTFPILVALVIIGFLDTGSPLFLQKRIGRGGQVFTLVKFRTMSIATKSVATHLVDVSSITKFGAFLRSSKLDELPQMINVLLGQMSFVGPRPCLPSQTDLIHERSQRGVFNVVPGITGIAQINNVDMSTPRKLARYDKLLVDNYSFKLYIYCFIRTAFGAGQGDKVKRKT